jgi:glycosyltransferase involved in cell wall biosynthesis
VIETPVAPTLEVVICTFNNSAMLDGVLSALARQVPFVSPGWTCLVVDNNCADDTQHVVFKHIASGAVPGLRSVREPEQGLTPSRLRGVQTTTAIWIAFVDDNCFLQPDWVMEALSFDVRHPDAGAFGGRVILDWHVEPPNYVRNFTYRFAEQNRGDTEQEVPFLAGAGLVVNRDALAACGWTDGPLVADRVGKNLISGGDVEIVLQIASAGYALWYAPRCVLHHNIPEWRTTKRYLKSMNRNLGVSQSLADAPVSEGTTRQWFFRSILATAKRTLGVTRLAAQVIRRSKSRTDFSIQMSFMLGQLQGIFRILKMPRNQRRQLIGRARRPSGQLKPRHSEPS